MDSTILYPLAGGVIIGVSASIMLLFNGKITGISGILANILGKSQSGGTWRYLFILGLILGGLVLKLFRPELFNYQVDNSYISVIVAGLLVGFGTRLGSGCTSGHGVCGLPRFSARSLVATMTFMAVAIVTVFIKGLL